MNASTDTRACFFCGANPTMGVHEALTRMCDCNNCKVDIQVKGGWTGDGWRIVQALIAEHGNLYVAKVLGQVNKARNK